MRYSIDYEYLRLPFVRNTTKIREGGHVLYEEIGLQYNAQQNLSNISLLLHSSKRSSENDGSYSAVVKASDNVWEQLSSNRSSVYLHVLLLKSRSDTADHRNTVEIVNSKVLNSGDALYGVVGLVKYDKIPRHFKHRYLLSDFGMVDIPEEEGW